MALDPSTATMLDIVNKLNDMTGVNNKLDLLNAYNATLTNNNTIKTNLVTAVNNNLGQSATIADSYNTLISKITNVVNRGAVTMTPGLSDQAIAAGYHNGSGKVKGDANLASANILSGKSIFGVSGTAVSGTPVTTGTYPVSSSGSTILDITNLTFTPSVVIFSAFYSSTNELYGMILNKTVNGYSVSECIELEWLAGSYSYTDLDSYYYIKTNGFYCNFGDISKLSYANNVYWWAYK